MGLDSIQDLVYSGNEHLARAAATAFLVQPRFPGQGLYYVYIKIRSTSQNLPPFQFRWQPLFTCPVPKLKYILAFMERKQWDHDLLKRICEQTGVSLSTAANRVYYRPAADPFRPKNKREYGFGVRDPNRIQKIIQFVDSGKTMKAAGKRFGVSPERIRQIYKTANQRPPGTE